MFGKGQDLKAFEAGAGISSPPLAELEAPPPYQAGNANKAPSSSNYQSPIPELIPHPANLLTIHAHGTGSFYCSNNELVIPIYSGTDTTQQPLYVSTRAKKSSNSAVLSHRTEGNIISTTYRLGFGKSRQPKIRYIRKEASYGSDVHNLSDDEDAGPVALTASTNGWTNTTTMTSETNPDQVLTWRYIKTSSTDKAKLRVMALYADSASSSSRGKGEGEPVAVLVRSENTRTPGTSRWGAGNGGQLVLNSTAYDLVNEGLIVASCLMCLKKENDRNRDATVVAVT